MSAFRLENEPFSKNRYDFAFSRCECIICSIRSSTLIDMNLSEVTFSVSPSLSVKGKGSFTQSERQGENFQPKPKSLRLIGNLSISSTNEKLDCGSLKYFLCKLLR